MLDRPSLESHPCFGAFGRKYYPAVFGDDRTNISFSSNGITVLATQGVDGIDYYGFPVQVLHAPSATEQELLDAMSFVDGNRVRIADYLYGNSPLALACNSMGLGATLRTNAHCDLSGGEKEIHRSLRKSYRSLVNWGRKNIALTYVNTDNPDRSACAEYQEFHKRIAGRSTRPQETWDIMFEWIMKGEGELTLGHLSTGELVSGTLVIDGTEVSYYTSGVYDRARFDKPMGHWSVYNSIIRSAERGMNVYDLGDIPPPDAPKKEFDIGMFKRGFASKLTSYAVWG